MPTLNQCNATFETTKRWLRDLMAMMDADEAKAYRALRVTLQELRDHLSVDETADFASQLPILFRGLFYEGWKPAGKPLPRHTAADFLARIAVFFPDMTLDEVGSMVRQVFSFLERRISAGEIRDILSSLPKEIRNLWPASEDESLRA